MSGGGMEREFAVTSVMITDRNFATGVVSGTAAAGSHVIIAVESPEDFAQLDVTTNTEGNWSADFSALADLTYVSDFDASQGSLYGGGTRYSVYGAGVTAVRNEAGTSNIDHVEGERFPKGASITLTVDDLTTIHTYTGIVGDAPWNPDLSFVDIELDIELQPGFIINMSAAGMGREFTLTPLTITNADFVNDVVYGTAELGSDPRKYHVESGLDYAERFVMTALLMGHGQPISSMWAVNLTNKP